MLLRRFVLFALTFVALCTSTGRAEVLKVVGWNLESGDAEPSYLAAQIRDFQGVDLWGFSEVQKKNATAFAVACAVGEDGQQFQSFVGNTGGSDRLVIVYNASKLELVGQPQELLELRVVTGRAPLFGVFKIKSSGEQFIFMVNHLHRTNPDKRMEQAVGLEKWAKNQALPAVLVGDYNFDVKVKTKQGNSSFVAMTDENVFHWVEPTPFRATHKSGGVLDFVFLAGPAKKWTSRAEVVKLADDEVDTLQGTDHRPVQAELNTTPDPFGPVPLTAPAKAPIADAALLAAAEARQKKRNEILRRLSQLERELVTLRRMIRDLADD